MRDDDKRKPYRCKAGSDVTGEVKSSAPAHLRIHGSITYLLLIGILVRMWNDGTLLYQPAARNVLATQKCFTALKRYS